MGSESLGAVGSCSQQNSGLPTVTPVANLAIADCDPKHTAQAWPSMHTAAYGHTSSVCVVGRLGPTYSRRGEHMLSAHERVEIRVLF